MPLAKSVLLPLGLTAASATHAAVPQKIYGFSMRTLIMKDIIEMILKK